MVCLEWARHRGCPVWGQHTEPLEWARHRELPAGRLPAERSVQVQTWWEGQRRLLRSTRLENGLGAGPRRQSWKSSSGLSSKQGLFWGTQITSGSAGGCQCKDQCSEKIEKRSATGERYIPLTRGWVNADRRRRRIASGAVAGPGLAAPILKTNGFAVAERRLRIELTLDSALGCQRPIFGLQLKPCGD